MKKLLISCTNCCFVTILPTKPLKALPLVVVSKYRPILYDKAELATPVFCAAFAAV